METLINIHTHLIKQNAEIEVFNVIAGKDNLNSGVYTCGIHPWYIADLDEQLSILNSLARNKNCLAIGECGLDKIQGTETSLQEKAFVEQILLATKLNKPLIIHCVKKHEALAQLLIKNSYSDYFLLHGFSANPVVLQHFNKLPKLLVSFGTALLKEDTNAVKLFKEMPIEKCFLETDDSNESIENIYLRAAEIKKISLAALKLQIQLNYNKVFINGRN